MFGIGLPEMIVIMAVALVVVGPDKLPELARSLAKGVNELKNTMNQLKENLSEETKVISSVQEDLKKTTGALAGSLLDNDPKIWQQEDSLPESADDESEVIDLQPLEERPWERDAHLEPELKDEHTDPPAPTREQETATENPPHDLNKQTPNSPTSE